MIRTYLFDFLDKTIKEKEFENSSIPESVLNDIDLFLYWICKQIFPIYTIIDHQRARSKKGDPDFILINLDTGKKIFVEMKTVGEYGLNYNQLKFMFENKDSYVLFYSVDNASRKNSLFILD